MAFEFFISSSIYVLRELVLLSSSLFHELLALYQTLTDDIRIEQTRAAMLLGL